MKSIDIVDMIAHEYKDRLSAAVLAERQAIIELIEHYSKANMKSDNMVHVLEHLKAAVQNRGDP